MYYILYNISITFTLLIIVINMKLLTQVIFIYHSHIFKRRNIWVAGPWQGLLCTHSWT